MKTHHLIPLAFAALVLCGCSKTTTFVASATGNVYDLLVVMKQSAWDGTAGDTTRAVLGKPMYGMPQPERTFTVSHVTKNAFNDKSPFRRMCGPLHNVS